jgi:O-phospho-L-seryl-tRNASec:L-selenocysteinyl-tRNA synthase
VIKKPTLATGFWKESFPLYEKIGSHFQNKKQTIVSLLAKPFLLFCLKKRMDKLEDIAGKLVKPAYVRQGLQNLASRQQLLSILFTHKKLPVIGWDDATIEFMLNECASMDSNNFMSNVGVGEREGRVFSDIVFKRNYRMSHGIGRSGDIAEVQPKAAGSSLLYKLCCSLVQHAMQLAGLTLKNCVVLPLATGMSLTMCFLTLKRNNPNAQYIIWSCIDQKSCFKSIITAGYEPLIVQLRETEDGSGALETDLTEIQRLLELHGQNVLCVLSTTSCFAPRQPDSIDAIARLCTTHNIGHVINNAYGIQCPIITKLITRATVVGRVDYVVQSTDKNFMVPVGGAIVISPDKEKIKKLSAQYPGRANMSPIMDVLITLLAMGEKGFKTILEQRNIVNKVLIDGLQVMATTYGEVLMVTPRNSISTAVSLKGLDAISASFEGNTNSNKGPTFLGSMLFQRGISGCRVVPKLGEIKRVEGYEFVDWGSHYNNTPYSYFTAACAVGTTIDDVNIFLQRLGKVVLKLYPASAPESTVATMPTVLPVPVPAPVNDLKE